jgi:hypothetical protein
MQIRNTEKLGKRIPEVMLTVWLYNCYSRICPETSRCVYLSVYYSPILAINLYFYIYLCICIFINHSIYFFIYRQFIYTHLRSVYLFVYSFIYFMCLPIDLGRRNIYASYCGPLGYATASSSRRVPTFQRNRNIVEFAQSKNCRAKETAVASERL